MDGGVLLVGNEPSRPETAPPDLTSGRILNAMLDPPWNPGLKNP